MRVKDFKIEQLLVPRLLRDYGLDYSPEEIVAKLSLLGLPESIVLTMREESRAATFIRSAVLFAIDFEEAQAAMNTMDAGGEPELPPLPFPRIAIEAACDDGWEILGREEGTDREPELLFIVDVISIYEVDPGQKWGCLLFLRLPTEVIEGLEEKMAFVYVVNADGSVEVPVSPNDRPFSVEVMQREVGISAFMQDTVVNLVHLITAKGVTTSVWDAPRAERRRAARAGFSYPIVYLVGMEDGQRDYSPGSGESFFRHRWLVRGHWMRHESGTHLIQSKGGTCVWRRAHVRGPAGAPWKGKPIYVGAA